MAIVSVIQCEFITFNIDNEAKVMKRAVRGCARSKGNVSNHAPNEGESAFNSDSAKENPPYTIPPKKLAALIQRINHFKLGNYYINTKGKLVRFDNE